MDVWKKLLHVYKLKCSVANVMCVDVIYNHWGCVLRSAILEPMALPHAAASAY